MLRPFASIFLVRFRSLLYTSPRIICLFRSPHTSNPFEPFPACVSLFFSAGSYRRGCRCNPGPAAVPYLSGEVRRKARESTAFCCFLHVRELIYDSGFARKARCMCASIVTRKREEARETVSTVPFISPVSRSYISGDSGISSRREIAMKNRVYSDASSSSCACSLFPSSARLQRAAILIA